MCGISGWSMTHYPISKERKAILAGVLTTLNDSRGGDSAGWYSPKSGISKVLGDIGPHSATIAKEQIVMLHTRKATTGGITVENSHPFVIGEIIGAHNGMIMNHRELERKYNRNCEVDSMHLFHHINEGLPFSDITGYGAIQYVRKDEPRKIYLCKMRSGELAVRGIGEGPENCKGVIWSSDKDHLEKAVEAAQIPTFPYKIETGAIYYISGADLFKSEKTHDLAEREWYSMPDWRNGYNHGSDSGSFEKNWSSTPSYNNYSSKKQDNEYSDGDEFFEQWMMEQKEMDRRLGLEDFDDESLTEDEIQALIDAGELPNRKEFFNNNR